jgi:hypothetical protein
MPATRSWRLNPSPFVEHHVERLAREENRSLSNMMERLITEAINHRRQAEAMRPEISRLAAVIAAGSSPS